MIMVVAAVAGVGLALLRQVTVYPGVHVAGTDVGGLTKAEVKTRLTMTAAEKARDRLTVRCGGRNYVTTLGEIGWQMPVDACVEQAYSFGREGNTLGRLVDILSARRKGVELHTYTFSRAAAAKYLETAARDINRPPANARLTFKEGIVTAIPEKPGVKLDLDKSLERIARTVDAGGKEADLMIATVPPDVTTADLKGIDGIIASYSTPYKAWQRDRTYNLKIACETINGTLIKPRETFSYNKVVGPRLKEYGFRDAPMFVDGQVEPGTGGGVCQVSTTVYNTALLANMQILRRSHHSRPVVYAPVGRDATVAYPAIDLRFRNTTDGPVYIMASVGPRTVSITMLGKRSDGRKVELLALGHRVIRAPVTTARIETSDTAKTVVQRAGRSGHQVSIYRIVKEGGEVVKRELISTDYYPPEPRIVAVAVPKPQSQPATP